MLCHTCKKYNLRETGQKVISICSLETTFVFHCFLYIARLLQVYINLLKQKTPKCSETWDSSGEGGFQEPLPLRGDQSPTQAEGFPGGSLAEESSELRSWARAGSYVWAKHHLEQGTDA